LREAFTHLAHGARAIDISGVGMEETNASQHIDHRDHAMFKAVRDLTHAIGFAEDLLAESIPVQSPVAIPLDLIFNLTLAFIPMLRTITWAMYMPILPTPI
jgi:hypothetical protein